MTLLVAMSLPQKIKACPCGCGALGPLVLSAIDTWKFQGGITHRLNRNYVGSDGSLGIDDGPEQSQQLTLGIARRVSSRVSASVQGAYEENQHSRGGAHGSLIDPSVGIRVKLNEPSALSGVPLVHLFTSYKHAFAKGLLEPAVLDHQLDIHGNSLREMLSGIDLWFGDPRLTVGLGAGYIHRFPVRVYDDSGSRRYEKSPAYRLALSVSHTFIGKGQLMASIERESKGSDRIDGDLVDDSSSLSHRLQVAGTVRVGNRRNVTFDYSRAGFVKASRNTPRQDSFGASFTQAI